MPSGLAKGNNCGGIFWDVECWGSSLLSTYFFLLNFTVVLPVEQMGHIVLVFLVGIRSVFLRYYQYHTGGSTFRSQKRGSAPRFPQRGARCPFSRSPSPFWKKGGRKGGHYTKKGWTILTEIPKIQQIWYPVNTDNQKVLVTLWSLYGKKTLPKFRISIALLIS